jgi:hypothetical protein
MTRFFLALGAALLASCGLIDSSVDDFAMTARKDFGVDTAQWNLGVTAGEFPSFPCADDAACAVPADMICGNQNCTVTCVANECQAHVTVTKFETFDLETDSPELSMVNDKVFVDVVIDSIDFVIDPDTTDPECVKGPGVNSLNFTIPPLQVFLGANDVTDPSDPDATLLGTIPAIAENQMGTISMILEDAGRTVLSDRIQNYTEMFNMIVTTTIDISAGDEVPAGMLSGCVRIRAHADVI